MSDIGAVLGAVGAADRELFRRVAGSHSAILDRALPPLSRAADHSVLWMVTATGLASTRRPALVRAAVRGLTAVGVASVGANQVGKRTVRRRRPVLDGVPLVRRGRMPGSTSFPSGHAASAAAFAVGASLEAPVLAVPLGVAAAAVAFSRVYTAVHYPGDVLAGAALGTTAALTLRRIQPFGPARAGRPSRTARRIRARAGTPGRHRGA